MNAGMVAQTGSWPMVPFLLKFPKCFKILALIQFCEIYTIITRVKSVIIRIDKKIHLQHFLVSYSVLRRRRVAAGSKLRNGRLGSRGFFLQKQQILASRKRPYGLRDPESLTVKRYTVLFFTAKAIGPSNYRWSLFIKKFYASTDPHSFMSKHWDNWTLSCY